MGDQFFARRAITHGLKLIYGLAAARALAHTRHVVVVVSRSRWNGGHRQRNSRGHREKRKRVGENLALAGVKVFALQSTSAATPLEEHEVSCMPNLIWTATVLPIKLSKNEAVTVLMHLAAPSSCDLARLDMPDHRLGTVYLPAATSRHNSASHSLLRIPVKDRNISGRHQAAWLCVFTQCLAPCVT